MRHGVLGLSVLFFACGIADAANAMRPLYEEAAQRWVVYPARDNDAERSAFAARFVRETIAERFPELELVSARGGGLTYRLRADRVEGNTSSIHTRLQALPGVMASAPLPSDTEVRLAKARALARGGLDSMAAGIIVKYRSPENRANAKAGKALAARDLGALQAIAEVPFKSSRPMSGEAYSLRFEQPMDIHSAELAAERIALSPDVEYASVNGYRTTQLTSTDPSYATQWNLTNAVSGINIEPAWAITTGSSQIVVAVIDTGLLAHPEFSSRIVQGYDFITETARSNDGNGRDSNATDAGNWVSAGYCSTGSAARDSNWHGTHVAGIIGAAGNNGTGIAGVNWQSRILPVRVLGKCGGTDDDILDGLRWAVGLPVPGVPNNANPARVVNMSLGGTGSCFTHGAWLEAVLSALGNRATVVVAAGNEDEPAMTHIPASCIGTIKVAAVGPSGDKAPYSNYSKAIEVAAPGGETRLGQQWGILSTVGSGTQSDAGSAAYKALQGTSMAAPHVAGVASLILSVQPNLTVAEVRDVIRFTSRPFPAGSSCKANSDCGWGILDAGAAVTVAAGATQHFNFSDQWWVPAELGWGLNLQQQGDVIFGTWFTYGPDGQPLWFVIPRMDRIGEDFFQGDIYRTTGTPLAQINGRPAIGQATKVGNAIVAFFGLGLNINTGSPYDAAVFTYQIGSTSGAKSIVRQMFSDLTICNFTSGSRAGATNYQDIWWNPAEDGWGLNLTHQGNIIFATWFTYAPSGQPLWLVAPNMARTSNGVYTGAIYSTTGVPYHLINNAQSSQSVIELGQMTLTFTNGETARMDYRVGTTVGSKSIQRQGFSTPRQICRPLQ